MTILLSLKYLILSFFLLLKFLVFYLKPLFYFSMFLLALDYFIYFYHVISSRSYSI